MRHILCVCVQVYTFVIISWLIISVGVTLCRGVSSDSISFNVHEGGY